MAAVAAHRQEFEFDRQISANAITGLLSRPHKYRLVHPRMRKIPDSPIGVVIGQTPWWPGRRFVSLEGPTPPCDRFAQLRIGEDEVDDLLLRAQRGCAIFAGQLTIKLVRRLQPVGDNSNV
jgi:hypothetical protein